MVRRYKSFQRDHPYLASGMKLWKTAQIARGAYKMARKIARVVNSEKKYHDVTLAIAPDTTASVTCLTSMAQGDTELLRHGNSIKMEQLYVKGNIVMDTAVPNEIVRILIVRDNDNNQGTAPTISEVLESSGVLYLANKDHSKRFKILMDRKYYCDTSRPAKPITFFKQFKMYKDKAGNPTLGQHCTFTAGTANDTGKGHVYFIVVGNTATASTSSQINCQSRFRFYDN